MSPTEAHALILPVSEISVRSADGTRPHSSLITMGNDTNTAHREKLIPRASWKPNHQPMASVGPKLQIYGDAAPRTVWRRKTRPKTHKGRHSSLFKERFLWFQSNCQCTTHREREREIQEAQRKSLVHLSLSFSG